MKLILLLSLVMAGFTVAAWFLFFKEPVFKTTNGWLVNLDGKVVIIEVHDPGGLFYR